MRWAAFLELLILRLDIRKEIFAQILGCLDHFRIWARDMQVHGLVAFPACGGLHKARATAFDLHTASSFLLDVFDISAPMANNLSSQVESWDRFKVDGNPLFRPFAPSKLITFELFWFATTESTLVN